MKFHKGYIEFKNGTIISWWEQWSQLFKNYNWKTYQLFNLEFENDYAMHGIEITIVLFLFGLRIRIETHPIEAHEIHTKVMKSLNILKESCWGWTTKREYDAFRKKKRETIVLYTKRKYTSKSPKDKYKKVFLQ